MSKGILGWNQQDVLTQFQNGKAAMMVNGPWQIPVLREQSPGSEVGRVDLAERQTGRLDPGR